MSIKEEIGKILQKYHYEETCKVPEIKGAKHYNRINEATLKKNAPRGMAIINKAVNFLMTESEEEQHYNFSTKKDILSNNLICDPIIKDKKIIGLYIYLIKESTLAEDEEISQAFWIDGYFNEKGEFLGRGEGFDDDLIWSTY